MGTPHYMSPELLSCKDYGFKTDVWWVMLKPHQQLGAHLPAWPLCACMTALLCAASGQQWHAVSQAQQQGCICTRHSLLPRSRRQICCVPHIVAVKPALLLLALPQVAGLRVLRAHCAAPHLQRVQHPRPGQQDTQEQAGAAAR